MSRRTSGRLAAMAQSDPASPASSVVTPSRVTRSSRTKTVNAISTAASPAAPDSRLGSSNSSPTRYLSEGSLSTPPTTNTNTPLSDNASGKGKLPGFQSASSLVKMEVVLPDKPSTASTAAASSSIAADSVKALKSSKFSLSVKRERADVESGDEEDVDGGHVSSATQLPLLKSVSPKKLKNEIIKEEDLGWLSHDSNSSAPAEISLIAFDAPANRGKRRRLTTRSSLQTLETEPQSTIASGDGLAIVPKTESTLATMAELAFAPNVGLTNIMSAEMDISEVKNIMGYGSWDHASSDLDDSPSDEPDIPHYAVNALGTRRQYREYQSKKRVINDRDRLEEKHPALKTMWKDLEDTPVLKAGRASQPKAISRSLKPFQLEGLAWMIGMEKTSWKGGLLGDEMGLGKTIQAVSLIMSDYPAKKPTLVLVPPVALMQWTSEIAAYTDGRLKTFIYHSTNVKSKGMAIKDIKQYDVIMMSYNSLESIYRKQEKGFSRKAGVYKEKSIIHQTHFHRVILDEAHCIKTRSTMTAKACFSLKVDYRWCLTGTPLQNRIGEFFSLLRFLQIEPFANYVCRDCECCKMEWSVDINNMCIHCGHRGMRHLSVFNQELLNPIQRYGNFGPGNDAFKKLRILTDRVMLRRLKKDHTDSMELPVKEVVVDRQFFSEFETDFADSIMTNSKRKFTTYVENRVLLNNYANIFGLIMQMRQVADHPDLIVKKNAEGSQNVLFCCICDEPAEEAIRSKCKHDFCRECARSYLHATNQPDCPRCHIALSIDLEQPEFEQDELMVKKTSIINRIRMENWTSSSKIELLVHNLYRLRSDKASHKSIIFSQFTTMLQLIEWRLHRAGITTVMLDGSMTPAQRQASIEYFKRNVDVECFLVSLKAGGVALNLTEASRVFIVDPWWNPAAEWQSADRCHRIGQTRPCVVTRLCIEDSVESRMVLLQEKKTRMINSTINSDDAAMESLTPEDLQFLFRGN